MTVRERFQLTISAIESVLANTTMPFRLVFAGAQTPQWLRDELQIFIEHPAIRVVHFDTPLWPQQVRRKLVAAIDTEYVVFLDNDLLVSPGWLEALVTCADETGAGLVGPLYLWGDGNAPPRVHMAGGALPETPEGGRRVLAEEHIGCDQDPRLFPPSLGRRPCDFLEYHCMLFRTHLAQDPDVLDERMRCVHEHIDAALAVRSRGYPVLIDFASRVLYRAFAPTAVEDLPVMRRRWTAEQMERDIATFCAKWNVIPDDRSFAPVRRFIAGALSRVEPIRIDSRRGDLHQPMHPGELVHTRNALLDLALARGYGIDDARILNQSIELAQSLTNGGYRPRGRPFINHLLGTAGVLLRYDFRLATVIAGLLHASYTHGRLPCAPGTDAGSMIQESLRSVGDSVEARIRAYTFRHQQPLRVHHGLSVAEGERAAIEVANEIDMRFSGEYAYSGRAAELDAAHAATLDAIMRALGVAGLGESLHLAMARQHDVKAELVTGIAGSYRLGPDLSRQYMVNQIRMDG